MTSIQRIKREAREIATTLGHTLGRFSCEGAEYEKGTYYLARCKGCSAAVVVSEDRYRTAWAPARVRGGEAVTLPCLSPYIAPEGADEPADDEEEAA